MLKHISLLLCLCVFSLSARVTVINQTDEDIQVNAGFQGWQQYKDPITVRKKSQNYNAQSGVGGIILKNTAGTKNAGPFYIPGKETWQFDSITATVTKDAAGNFKAVIEPKQTI